MTDLQLSFYSSWTSIASLLMSVVSLAYIRSIKANIIKFRRKQRIRQLLQDVLDISAEFPQTTRGLDEKLAAVKRNLPIHSWSRLTPRGRITIVIHAHLDARDIVRSRKRSMIGYRIRRTCEQI